MADAYSHQSGFIVVVDRRHRCLEPKNVFSTSAIIIFVLVFYGICTAFLKIPQVVFPKASSFQVPYLWVHRAITYGNHSAAAPWFGDANLTEMFDDNLQDFRLICYYNFPGTDQYDALFPDEIDPFLCTHINAAFGSVRNCTLALDRHQLEILAKLVNLKRKNQNLKVLVSVGGAGNDAGFGEMVLNHANRKRFIRSVVDLVKSRNVDGVDLDWEFPSQYDQHDKRQKIHFTQLLREIRAEIRRQNRHKFLITVAVAAPPFLVDISYDVPYMSQFVDFVNLMSYDYHFYTSYTPFTGLNSPLFPCGMDYGYFLNLNINCSVSHWVSRGMEQRKIVVGLPTYGHSYRLINRLNHDLYAPANGYGRLGSKGFVDYSQICAFMNSNNITPVFEEGAESPYLTKFNEWVSFDNEQSLSVKAEFVANHRLGGVMVYALNTDDYRGTCKMNPKMGPSVPFPLTRKVREVLQGNYSIF